MQRYMVLTKVILGFINEDGDQVDAFIGPGVVLEFDGSTIWVLRGDKKIESTTTASFIATMLYKGVIREAGQSL